MSVPQIARSGGRMLSFLVLLATLLAAAACASWVPPVFSPALSSNEPCVSFVGAGASAPLPAAAASGATERLTSVVDDIERARKRYIHTARCLTQDTSLGGAALIGLSSVALFKGVTSPHAKDMAGLGVLGGLTYLSTGGDTAIGQRRLVYYAGADALSCTLKAAEPFRWPVHSSARRGPATLGQLVEEALEARDQLLGPERKLQIEFRSTVTLAQPGRRVAADCASVNARKCDPPAAGASNAELAIFRACQSVAERCTPGGNSVATLAAHPSVKPMLRDIVKARDDIDKLSADAATLEALMDTAAGRIGEQSANIQTQVAREADKTFPDIAAVLASTGKLRSVAFTVSGASPFGDGTAPAGPQAGQTHSGLGASKSRAVPEPAMQEATDALGAAIRAATNLRHALLSMQQRLAAVKTEVQSCTFSLTAAAASAPAAPGGEAGTGGSGGGAASPAPVVIATEIDRLALAALLGRPSDATGEQLQEAVKTCQQKVLNRPGATGATLDTETMSALLKGSCRGTAG